MTGHLPVFPYIEESYARLALFLHESSSDSPDDSPGESRIRVLVVDDEIRVADTTAEVLQTSGFDAMPAYSAQSALELAATFRPDCLLSDVVMSGMSGVELAMAFRQRHPSSRVVLISGQVGVSDILDEAARQGLQFEVLAKPIHPRKLIDKLRKTQTR
jgi:CheY-like chemotaxis protein